MLIANHFAENADSLRLIRQYAEHRAAAVLIVRIRQVTEKIRRINPDLGLAVTAPGEGSVTSSSSDHGELNDTLLADALRQLEEAIALMNGLVASATNQP
jgi:hypothetical protein